MKRKRPDRFVVGYRGINQCVYAKIGVETWNAGRIAFIDPMKFMEAKKHLKSMPDKGAVIYELVEVKK